MTSKPWRMNSQNVRMNIVAIEHACSSTISGRPITSVATTGLGQSVPLLGGTTAREYRWDSQEKQFDVEPKRAMSGVLDIHANHFFE